MVKFKKEDDEENGIEIIYDDEENYERLEEKLNYYNNLLKSENNNLINEKDEEQITIIQDKINEYQNNINGIKVKLSKMSAIIYYTKASIFSEWVYENLSVVEEGHLQEISGQEYQSMNNNVEEVTYNFSESTRHVFDTKGNTTENGIIEIPKDSPFYTHKLNVIRNSIQYNLNLAMTTYNQENSGLFNYEMPVIQNEEWDQILSNISFVSFMQGYSCGLKTYNNYMVVSSTNNEFTVNLDHIYYVPKDNFSDESTEYHKKDCGKLPIIDSEGNDIENYISFTSKEVKYDKILERTSSKYTYDHKNYACYTCINDGNYISSNWQENPNLKKMYYISVGKERNDIYKMNAVKTSEGYETIYWEGCISGGSTRTLSEIKAIEIDLGTIHTKTLNTNQQPLRYTYKINGIEINLDNIDMKSIQPNNSSVVTINMKIPPKKFENSEIKIKKEDIKVTLEPIQASSVYIKSPTEEFNENTVQNSFQNAIKCIRVIYK